MPGSGQAAMSTFALSGHPTLDDISSSFQMLSGHTLPWGHGQVVGQDLNLTGHAGLSTLTTVHLRFAAVKPVTYNIF